MRSITRSLSKLSKSKGSSSPSRDSSSGGGGGGGGAKMSSKELQGLLRKVEHNEAEVTRLDMSCVKISNKDYNILLESVEKNQVLQEIDISNNGLEDIAIAELLNRVDISGNRKLRRMNLSGNCFGRNGGKAIEGFLGKHLHVIEMDVSGQTVSSLSKMGITDTKEFDVKAMSKGQRRRIVNLLRSNATVTNFALKKTNRLECIGRGIVVADGFLPNHWAERMTALDMSNNAILHVPAAMSKFTALQELQLSSNQLGSLPEWIGDLKALKVVDVSNNNLSALPDSLTKLTLLQTLNVSQNYITHLPLGLAALPSLYILSAEGNPIENVPEDIVSASLYGDQGILRYIRSEWNAGGGVGGGDDVKEDSTASSFMETQLCSGGGEDGEIQLRDNPKTKKRLLEEAKNRSSISVVFMEVAMAVVMPSTDAITCSCKAGDAVWMGTRAGQLHEYDSRTLRLRQTLDAFESAVEALCFVGMPHLQLWAGDSTGTVAIFDCRSKGLRVEQISPHSGICGFGYCSKAQEMWVASAGRTIYPVSVAAPVVEKTIDLDGREITAILVVGQEVWIGCRDGTITILSQQAHAILAIFKAHPEAVTCFLYTGKYIFSAAREKLLKVWTRKAKTWDCMMILEVANECDPQLAFGNGTLYTTGGPGGTIMVWDSENQFSLTSKLKTTRGETISSLVWTPSPDRLWSTSKEGTALCHELKRGRKTMERLKEKGAGDSTASLVINTAGDSLGRDLRDSADSNSITAQDICKSSELSDENAIENPESAKDGSESTDDGSVDGERPDSDNAEELVAVSAAEQGKGPTFESYPNASALDIEEDTPAQSLDPLDLLDSMEADIAQVAHELDNVEQSAA